MITLNLNITNLTKAKIPAKAEIENTIMDVLKSKTLDGIFEVDLKIVSIQEIHTLNREYRDIDKPTDVLSFPIHQKVDTNTPQPVLLGDIVLCPEMAEAVNQESIEKLIEHSILHLLGYHHAGD